MSAQQDAVTAHAAMVLELMIGGLNREGAEAKVTAYDQVRRAEVLREAADLADRISGTFAGFDDEESQREAKDAASWARILYRMADGSAM